MKLTGWLRIGVLFSVIWFGAGSRVSAADSTGNFETGGGGCHSGGKRDGECPGRRPDPKAYVSSGDRSLSYRPADDCRAARDLRDLEEGGFLPQSIGFESDSWLGDGSGGDHYWDHRVVAARVLAGGYVAHPFDRGINEHFGRSRGFDPARKEELSMVDCAIGSAGVRGGPLWRQPGLRIGLRGQS